MKELAINVIPMTEKVMTMLEGKGLIRSLSPTSYVLSTPENEVGVDYLYSTDPKFGPHTMVCVGFNRSIIDMAYHSDNEDFILINEGHKQKPLILVIGLHHAENFRRLVKTSQLTEEDIIALELKYNDPKVSFFIMNGFTPHFEWTPPGQGAASVFYVSEPHDLDINHIDLGDYQLKIIT